MTAAKLRLAMAATGHRETKIGPLCQELTISRQTLYRHVDPQGQLRPDGQKLLDVDLFYRYFFKIKLDVMTKDQYNFKRIDFLKGDLSYMMFMQQQVLYFDRAIRNRRLIRNLKFKVFVDKEHTLLHFAL